MRVEQGRVRSTSEEEEVSRDRFRGRWEGKFSKATPDQQGENVRVRAVGVQEGQRPPSSARPRAEAPAGPRGGAPAELPKGSSEEKAGCAQGPGRGASAGSASGGEGPQVPAPSLPLDAGGIPQTVLTFPHRVPALLPPCSSAPGLLYQRLSRLPRWELSLNPIPGETGASTRAASRKKSSSLPRASQTFEMLDLFLLSGEFLS